jgi:hypothetical protein
MGPVNRSRRRFQSVLAVLALLLSPGLAGPWLQLGHDCARQATGESPARSHGAEQHQHSDHSPGRQECHCLGACHTPSLPSHPPTLPSVVLRTPEPPAHVSETAVRVQRIPHLHPFALSPPSVG